MNYYVRNTIYGGNWLKSKAEQRLLPRLLKAKTKPQTVSKGFSGRHQVSALSGHKSRHVAEVVRGFCDAD